jgi:hypothetical protein
MPLQDLIGWIKILETFKAMAVRFQKCQFQSAATNNAWDAVMAKAEDTRNTRPTERTTLLASTSPRLGSPPENLASKRSPSYNRRKKDTLAYVSYYLPILRWLFQYERQWFLGDLTSGLTLACLLVPQGMSYAQNLAKVDPVHGLFAASIPCFIVRPKRFLLLVAYFKVVRCIRNLSSAVGGTRSFPQLVGWPNHSALHLSSA